MLALFLLLALGPDATGSLHIRIMHRYSIKARRQPLHSTVETPSGDGNSETPQPRPSSSPSRMSRIRQLWSFGPRLKVRDQKKMAVELQALSCQDKIIDFSENSPLDVEAKPMTPPAKPEQQEMMWAAQVGSVSQQVSGAYSAALAMASSISLPSFPSQPNATATPTAKVAPMSPFRAKEITGPPAPIWAQAYSELSPQQLAKADAASKLTSQAESNKKGEPPQGQALIGKLKVLKGHRDLMSIRSSNFIAKTQSQAKLRAEPAIASFLRERGEGLAERTLDDVLVAGSAVTRAEDAPRWIKQANVTDVIGTATRGPKNQRRAAAVNAIETIFKYGQSTKEVEAGERMSNVLGRLLTAGSGRLTVDAVADLVEGGHPSSLLERAANTITARDGRRMSLHPVDPAAQLAGLRLLYLLILCKDTSVIDMLCAHERLCSLISTLEEDAYQAMVAARAASPDAKGHDAPGRYQGFKPEVYSPAQLASLAAAGLGLRRWRPRVKGQKGLRILSLDGGGTRGVLTVGLLKQIVEASGGLEIYEAFDMVVGTSTGAIVAGLLGIKNTDVARCEEIYDTLIPEIFQKSPVTGPIQLISEQAFYDEKHWEAVLKLMLDEQRMLDTMSAPDAVTVLAMSTCISLDPAKLFVARNCRPAKPSRYDGSCTIRARHAIRISTAAPTLFTPKEVDGRMYCDGAFFANNPTAAAYYEAQRIWPDVPVEVVVSIGTGTFVEKVAPENAYGWGTIINQLIESATDTVRVHETLESFLPEDKYFRFNPKMVMINIDETDPNVLEEHKIVAREFFEDPVQQARLQELGKLLNPQKGGKSPKR